MAGVATCDGTFHGAKMQSMIRWQAVNSSGSREKGVQRVAPQRKEAFGAPPAVVRALDQGWLM